MTVKWSDPDKAQWILENGPVPEIVWIFERVGDIVYRRPLSIAGLPPWINTERVPILNYTAAGFDIQDLDIKEHTGENK